MNNNLIKIIKNLVLGTTEGLKANLLGPNFVSKSFTFTLKDYNPQSTLGHAYVNANTMHSSSPDSMDKKTLKAIENNALNHIEGLEQKSFTDISRMITDYTHDLEVKSKILGVSAEDLSYKDEGKELYKKFRDNLNGYVDKMKSSATTIVENELNTAANFGAFDGILHAAQNMGIEDPTVCKLGVNDEKKCKHCWRLWMSEDKITPRVYKLSELAGSPGDWKAPIASVSTTHPNCRDVLTLLSPGFGFEAGRITYKGRDENGHLWDEYSKQKS
jgi:hypothetical protein